MNLGARASRERGVALYLFVAGLFAFLGFAALAVDLGMLYTAQTQLQRAVDGGALAGAGWLGRNPGDETGAKAEAESYTEQHEAIGLGIDIDPTVDVEVEADTLVRVRAFRTEARAALGGPVTTLFARALGIDDADIAVLAAAVVAPGFSVEECLFPFIPPDAWIDQPGGERSSDGIFSDFDDAPRYEPGDFYSPPPVLDAGYPTYSGFGATLADQGKYIIAKAGGPGNFASAGWWYTMNNPPTQQGGGMNQVREAIRGDCSEPYSLAQGDPANIQTGFGANAIKTALNETLSWGPTSPDEAIACYRDPTGCTDLRRIRTMPLYDPRVPPGPGSSTTATVGNFAVVWLAGFCDAAPQSASANCAALPGGGGKGGGNNEKANTYAVMYLGPTSGYASGEEGESSSGVLSIRLVE